MPEVQPGVAEKIERQVTMATDAGAAATERSCDRAPKFLLSRCPLMSQRRNPDSVIVNRNPVAAQSSGGKGLHGRRTFEVAARWLPVSDHAAR